MSTLTKVFIFLVLFVAMVKLGMDITLFSHRVDWKDKWVKSENWRIEIERVKNEEIGEKNVQIENLMTGINILQREKENLEERVRQKDETIENLEGQVQKWQEESRVALSRLEKAQQQLDVQIATVQRLQELVEVARKRAEEAVARAAIAEQKLLEVQQQNELVRSDLAELERKLRLVYREKFDVQTKLQVYIDKFGIISTPIPSVRIDGKVLSYSRQLGAVVLNIGKDDRVKEGMPFSIYRPGKFVAKAIAKRVDKNLTVAEISLMQVEPIPGDECTNRMPTTSIK